MMGKSKRCNPKGHGSSSSSSIGSSRSSGSIKKRKNITSISAAVVVAATRAIIHHTSSPPASSPPSASSPGNAHPDRDAYAPDVTIVVGSGDNRKEYKEYGQVLYAVSEYFHAALVSGMKEAASKEFAFPDLDPSDWELFINLVKPCPTITLSQDNIDPLLPLLDRFGVSRMRHDCETIYWQKVQQLDPFRMSDNRNDTSQQQLLQQPWRMQSKIQLAQQNLPLIYDALQTCIEYNLTRTRCNIMLWIISDYLNLVPVVFDSLDLIEGLLAILRQNRDCRDFVWEDLVAVLPEHYACQPPETLLQGEVLPHLILAHIQQERHAMQLELWKHSVQQVLPATIHLAMDSSSSIGGGAEQVVRAVVNQDSFWNRVSQKIQAIQAGKEEEESESNPAMANGGEFLSENILLAAALRQGGGSSTAGSILEGRLL